MLGGERAVKWLDAERGRVLVESLWRHHGHRAQAADVTVVEGASVVECESDRGVAAFVIGKSPVVDQQRASESRLYDDPVSGGQRNHDELGASPTSLDR